MDISNIIRDIKSTSVIYMAIGSAMEHYEPNTITPFNNQQYPCILDNIEGKKIIILIDPVLEDDLKIDNIDLICTIYNTRYYKNNLLTVIAINKSFNYLNNSNNFDNDDYNFLLNIISLSLENKVKFIFQDYSGKDSTYCYNDLLDIFDKQEVIKYINFDITQKDCGCYVEFNHDMIKLDSENCFIQPKYMKLVDIKDYNNFINIYKSRIDILNYELIWSYNKSFNESKEEFININKIKFLYFIYDKPYVLDKPISLNDKLTSIRELIILIVNDIIISKDCEKSMIEYLITNIKNKSVFVKTMTVIKYLD